MTDNIVVFGCPRSGTSVTLELFAGLGWKTYFEPGMDFMARHITGDIEEQGYKAWCVKNPVELDQRCATPGLTCHLEHLRAFHRFRTVWIVRHPLDTICSLRKGLSTTSWRHFPKPSAEIQAVSDPILRGALLWRWCNDLGFNAAEPEVTIRYENLVSNPRKLAGELRRRFDIHPDPAVLEPVLSTITNPTTHQAQFQSQWMVDDHEQRVNRWRENLTRRDLRQILPVLGDLPEQFGYDMSEPRRWIKMPPYCR